MQSASLCFFSLYKSTKSISNELFKYNSRSKMSLENKLHI